MDDATVDSLKAALAVSPDNPSLVDVLLKAYLDRDEPDAALALLIGSPATLTEPAARTRAAQACLAAHDFARALQFADGATSEAHLIAVRALLALERHDDARARYQQAVASHPGLEDADLKARLHAKVRAFPGAAGGHKLRVIERAEPADDLAALVQPDEDRVTFADVGGLDDVKRRIHKSIILPFKKPSLFQRFKKRVGGGILMYGPPGVGKTLLARATAGECDARFVNVSIAEVLDMYIGESERKLHALFEQARSHPPAVMFFDEIEALGGKRQYSREGTSAKLVSLFLSEMDGFAQNNKGVLVLGATNVPWAVDAAFRRPGRFDRTLFVPPPDQAARARILTLHLADRPSRDDIDVVAVARKTSGFSGADLRHLVESAADEAIEASIDAADEVPIGQAHLLEALRDVKPTTLEWLTTARNHARYANEGGQYDAVLAFLEQHGKG